MTAKYGTPIFPIISTAIWNREMCVPCAAAFVWSLAELRKKSGGIFSGSGESTGSVGVVTINMPRIAYLASDEQDFYRRLDHMMDIGARSLKIKRGSSQNFSTKGFTPIQSGIWEPLKITFPPSGLWE